MANVYHHATICTNLFRLLKDNRTANLLAGIGQLKFQLLSGSRHPGSNEILSPFGFFQLRLQLQDPLVELPVGGFEPGLALGQVVDQGLEDNLVVTSGRFLKQKGRI